MGLVECGGVPCKIGFSAADLIAGHLAPLGILASLRHRDRTGEGMHVDLAMQQALFWAMQPAWDGPALGPDSRVRARDAWIVAAAEEAEVMQCLGALEIDADAGSVLGRLHRAGIPAGRVRDIGEVVADPLLVRRGMLRRLGPGGALLGTPYGLARREGGLIGAPDGDRAAVQEDWLGAPPCTTAPPA